MFYEEKTINGVLHFRTAPDGEWTVKPQKSPPGASETDIQATVETLGFEWVRSDVFWSSGGLSYSGAVTIQTNIGTLLLARVERVTSGIRRVLVKPDELNVMNR